MYQCILRITSAKKNTNKNYHHYSYNHNYNYKGKHSANFADLPFVFPLLNLYMVIDLKVLVKSFNCESRVCYVGNSRESSFSNLRKYNFIS